MKIDTSIAKKLLEFVLPYRKAALLSTLFVSLTVLISLLPPLLYRLLIDEGIRSGSTARIALYAGAIVLAVMASSAIQLVEEYFSCQFGLVMMNDVRNRLYRHLQALPLGYFHTTSTGPIIMRFTSDLLNLQKVVARTLPSVVTNLLMIIFSITIMLCLSWKLTLVTVAAIPAYAVFSLCVTKIVSAISARAVNYGDNMMTRLGEDFSAEGQTFFKLFGMQDARRQEFEALTGDIQNIRLKLSLWGRANNVAIDLIQSLGIVAIYFVGATILLENKLTLGTIIAFAAIAIRLYQPIAFFSSTVIDFPTAILSMDRINSIFAEKVQPTLGLVAPGEGEQARICPVESVNCGVVFDNVSFRYPGAPAGSGIRNVSFVIKRGERIAIAGPNGSGKTTLLMLMAGIYRPDAGEIYVAGVRIAELSQVEISRRLGVGLGQGFFINSTIEANLRSVKPEASQTEIVDVLQRADCMAFINALPDGISSKLGQSGLKLSSGQRQRLSLARLFLKGGDVLCFDETTANIDSESEELIVDRINNSSAFGTTVLISHNLKTIRQAKRILVLDQGVVVGDGAHAGLARSCPAYRKLFGEARETLESVEPLLEVA